MPTMVKKPDFLSAVTAAVAILAIAVLGTILALGMSDYRSARVESQRNADSHEAIDGLFVGEAVRFRMVYEVAVVGLLVHLGPLLAMGLKRRWLLVAASLGLIVFSIVAVFLAIRTRAPILAMAAATSTTLGPLLITAVMRRQQATVPG